MPKGKAGRLLIVDDEANTLASLSRAFRLAGHEATVCDSAAKALEFSRWPSQFQQNGGDRVRRDLDVRRQILVLHLS